MGMTASAWVNGGKGVEIHWAIVPTSLGDMLVAATDKGVCRLSFAEGREALEQRFPAATLVEGGEEFAALLSQVIEACRGADLRVSTISRSTKGTAFQEAVWRELRKIPAGETRSYADIAAAVGKPWAVARRGQRQWREQRRRTDPLPPRRAQRRVAGRICLWPADQGRAAPPRRRAGAGTAR